jgi:hypothetical protein
MGEKKGVVPATTAHRGANGVAPILIGVGVQRKKYLQ